GAPHAPPPPPHHRGAPPPHRPTRHRRQTAPLPATRSMRRRSRRPPRELPISCRSLQHSCKQRVALNETNVSARRLIPARARKDSVAAMIGNFVWHRRKL